MVELIKVTSLKYSLQVNNGWNGTNRIIYHRLTTLLIGLRYHYPSKG